MGNEWDKLWDSRREERVEKGMENKRYLVGPNYLTGPTAGTQMMEWHLRWAREALRVLKPGGWIIAYSGTRTYHWLAVAIELAGFEIRDQIHWLYGCLSDDTEILTETGWRRGVDVAVGDRVAAWDPETESVTLEPVEEKFLAPYSGPMRVLRNADTDQLLTPNHRVYHRTRQRKMEGGVRRAWWPEGWGVAEAGDVTRSAPTKLPTAGFADGPGVGGVEYAELLAFVWTEGGFDRNGSGVRVYQSPGANSDTWRRISRLVKKLVPGAKRYDRERVYESRVRGAVLSSETCWFFSGEMADQVRADLPGKAPSYELLWRMSLAEKVAFLDAAMAGDGSASAFEQKGREALEWFQTLAHLVGWSARVRMRTNRNMGTCALRRSKSTEMQSPHFQRSYDAHYEGDVWCVRVSTGAFLARRNGLVFATGNSGFPKSLNVSKAIDHHLGAEREVELETVEREATLLSDGGVEERERTRSSGIGTAFDAEGGTWARGAAQSFAVTKPATPEAEQWEGWGTALKPAQEPCVLARKPLRGSVAENVLKHGVGGLNVSRCKVGVDEMRNPPSGTDPEGRTPNAPPKADVPGSVSVGRWPANLGLVHSEDCRPLGKQRIRGSRIDKPAEAGDMRSGYGGGLAGARPARGIGDEDGMEEVEVFECVPGCPVFELNRQGPTTTSPVLSRPDTRGGGTVYGWAKSHPDGHAPGAIVGFGDTGGVARYFYCAKPSADEKERGLRGVIPCVKCGGLNSKAHVEESDGFRPVTAAERGTRCIRNDHPTVKPIDCMAWMIRLVTPPDGTVLDPFMGSGTTGCAAVREGFRFVGIDEKEKFARLAAARIEANRPTQMTLGF